MHTSTTHTLEKLLADVAVDAPLSLRNIGLFPLFRPATGARTYLTLDEAVAAGHVKIGEVSEGGAVPRIRFHNEGPYPVLLLDGEELVGAKQNRIVNLTILAPAEATIEIPVSCVEAGRWGYASRDFAPAGRAIYHNLRARKAARVTENLAATGRPDADQGEIWDDIAVRQARFGIHSPTGAAADLYATNQQWLDEAVATLRPLPHQVGAIFAIDGRIVGLDVFDHPATYAELAEKLLRSYALDAVETGSACVPDVPSRAAATAFLGEVATVPDLREAPAVGLGRQLRLKGPGLAGAALMDGETLVHLCAFRLPDEAPRGGRPMGDRPGTRRGMLRRSWLRR